MHNKFQKRIHTLINSAKLNAHQCGMIVRLITKHIELTQYLCKLKIGCSNTDDIVDSPNCNFCDQNESVNHFIMK